MEESTSLCSNCQRPIAASNFVIHSLHCQRNLTKCEKCGEAVPRSAMDEHESEFHAKVNCPDCHMAVERPQLEAHKKTACISRQQHCPFCELELPASEMYDHENYCGSRTKKCEDCGEYVMLKYEQLHIDSNHGFLKLDDEPGPIATWIKNDLESGSSRPAKSNNNQKPQLYTGKFDIGDEDEVDDMHSLFANLMKKKKVIAPAAYPGVAYPISDRPQRTISRSPPPYQEVMEDSTDLVALPCEFCEAMIPVNQLILHQTACRMDLTSFGRGKKSHNESSKKHYSGLVTNDSDNEGDEGDLNLGSQVPDEIPKQRVRQIGAFTDTRRNAIDEGNTDRRRNHSVADRKTGVDEGSEAALREDLEEEGIYLLPCEFCGDGYPPSLLLEHQDVCEYHPKSFREVQEVWPENKDGVSVKKPQESQMHHRSRKFDESDYNTFVDAEQQSNGARGKSNISNSYNDLRGNFTVASEWSDDSDSRPTSATGAIPKQKAGKLNIARKVNQEVQSARPSNAVMGNHSRLLADKGNVNSHGDRNQRYQIRNNLKDQNGGDDDDDDDDDE
ncbi:TRAF-type zinc finger domain-containing protein 1 isoform X1 [Frankliniella occidentalis]|uniref:TRAF-type zinc finger domain-containing protein 1 isoform X1 n=1 Tax=Frankliniella occidentalis TaxID=133901 RepID=A0A6J1ST94_FRAOC|nr:TRAF-type zinc finger domain-containing protein 1 isoform X1 [Frankliniella occidentalis]